MDVVMALATVIAIAILIGVACAVRLVFHECLYGHRDNHGMIEQEIHLVPSDMLGFKAHIASSGRCSTMQSDIACGRWQWQMAHGRR